MIENVDIHSTYQEETYNDELDCVCTNFSIKINETAPSASELVGFMVFAFSKQFVQA